MFEGAPIIDAARVLYTVHHTLVQAFRTPLRKGNADYRDFQRTSFCHGIKSREDHLVGEIAGNTEDNERVRTGSGHQASAFVAAAFSSWPPNWYRRADSTLSAKSASPRELKRSY